VWVTGVVAEGGGQVDRPGAAERADGEVTQAGHDLRAGPGAQLGGVLGEGHVTDVVQAVLDRPVPPQEVGEAGRAGLGMGEAGDRVHDHGPPPSGAKSRVLRVSWMTWATCGKPKVLELLRQNEAATSSTSLLPRTAERLEQITLLREHAPLGHVQQELCRVETQCATLMGRLAWDVSGQHDHPTAARYYNQAIAAASNVKDGWAEAFPRMFQRFLPVYTGNGDPQHGLYLAEQATARAADGSSHVIAGWSAAFAAEAHALLDEERKAKLLLDRADFHLSKVTADDPMFGVFGRDQLGGFVGACHLRFNEPSDAAWALQDSALRLGAGKEKDKSVILADRLRPPGRS
jgi:hypothetical protein